MKSQMTEPSGRPGGSRTTTREAPSTGPGPRPGPGRRRSRPGPAARPGPGSGGSGAATAVARIGPAGPNRGTASTSCRIARQSGKVEQPRNGPLAPPRRTTSSPCPHAGHTSPARTRRSAISLGGRVGDTRQVRSHTGPAVGGSGRREDVRHRPHRACPWLHFR